MIISIHIPKTAGATFAKLLEAKYARRLRKDYEDMPASLEYTLTNKFNFNPFKISNLQTIFSCMTKNVIHGHFVYEKYSAIPNAQFITWLRDPVKRLLSHYHYWHRHPAPNNSTYRYMIDNNLSILEFAKLKPLINLQNRFISNRKLDAFEFIGITEHFEKSIIRFNKIFDSNLATNLKTNSNPSGSLYEDIEPSIIQRIRDLNLEDMKLYETALTHLANLRYI